MPDRPFLTFGLIDKANNVIEAVPGIQLQRYSASIREPYFLDSLYSLTVGGYYYQRQYNEDLETRLGGRVSVSRRRRSWAGNVDSSWTPTVKVSRSYSRRHF